VDQNIGAADSDVEKANTAASIFAWDKICEA
jgi:hypothetical protein